ncbi:probable WRKY transcription factor 27 [Olea europaea subsp. europaea]|uniref:Probable WRKY transcription factor 27 n=1 Tax=Olea europaea subsp. europaea TaxID=158383 RepID=A0A8S0VCU0_OLEEU|nr:probable WRKY transcription factor 27 [Olea europaea subsp. europaea]
MDNDWDLFAVVKSCTAAAAAPSSSSTTTPVNNINMSAAEGPFLSSGYMSTFLDDDAPFVFPSLKEDRPDGAFEGLEEFCKEFSIDLALAAAASGITSTTTNTLPVGQVFQQQIQPSLGIHQMQPQHLSLQMQTENPLFGSSLSIRKTNSQPSRPRKRKNQQKMVVQIMTPEELYADSWAWRKYGRKHIKGSPYPRNYHRCSTSKGCAARKHVEKNPEDPALFVVSYSGEHTHPRPNRRSFFSRSTQTKLISPATTSCEPSTNTNIPIGLPNSSCSSSSLASSSSFSPNTPLMEGQNPAQNEDVEMVKKHVEVECEDENVDMVEEHVEVEYEDEDILIPNVSMSEEIFRGFRELGAINNGSAHSSDLQTQPWTSTSSTATFNASRSGGD